MGFAVGTAAIPAPESVPPQGAETIPLGAEVEVFYLPPGGERAALAQAGPLAVPRAQQATEFSVATGAYAGIAGDDLVLTQPVSRGVVTRQEAYGSSEEAAFETVRVLIPLTQVSLIRTKPSSTPAVVGTLVGAALDVTAVLWLASAVSHVE